MFVLKMQFIIDGKVKILQYVIYMDESAKEGKFYGNFYGGALIRSTDLLPITEELSALKQSLNLYGEVKWQKVTSQYLPKYLQLTNRFFDFIERDLIKIRIMFTHNYREPTNLTREQIDNTFTQLYYQFFKHAFGLQYSNPDSMNQVSLRLYFDELPINPSQKQNFKKFIVGLGRSADFLSANLLIRDEDIAEVRSHDHIILQCMDIVLGSMYFKLNDMHKEKTAGSYYRGKRTIAKEQLYKFINKRIRVIYPGFNIGISTGIRSPEDRWRHSYRHWEFISNEHRVRPEYAKKNQ